MQPLLVTAAIIEHDARVLVTKRPATGRQGGMWEFPGGKLEPGESPAQALERELLEELDLPVTVGTIFDVVYHRYDWGPILLLAYRCHPAHLHIHNLQVAEHRWLEPRKLEDLPFLPADGPLVARLVAEASGSLPKSRFTG